MNRPVVTAVRNITARERLMRSEDTHFFGFCRITYFDRVLYTQACKQELENKPNIGPFEINPHTCFCHAQLNSKKNIYFYPSTLATSR